MADWDLNSTLWAIAGTITDVQQKALDKEQDGWRVWLNKACLPMPVVTAVSGQCVISEFHNRATKLRSELTGDSLIESKLTPEQHAQIQELLIAKGLLKTQPDGEFGLTTRQAIKTFQESLGATQSGFLTHDQANQLGPAKAVSQTPPSAAPSTITPPVDDDVLCAGLLSNPIVRAASAKAVAEIKQQNATQGLSETGLRGAILTRITELLYVRNQSFAQAFQNQIRSTQTEIAYSCLPDVKPLIVDYRKAVELHNKAVADAAIEAAKPENKLFRAYRIYAFIKYCNEVRQGYVMIYINDVEMDRAREKIGGIEKDALSALNVEHFDTDALFQKAVNANRGLYANYQLCHSELSNLFKIDSSDGNFVIKKDF